MRHKIRNHLLIVGVLTMVFVPTGVAHASCIELPAVPVAMSDAETVFVGTVTSAEYLDRVATFQVEEIWKGDIGANVVVTGGPSVRELEAAAARGEDLVTSVDRSYAVGTRYLVVSYGSEGDVLLDNQCSVTQVYSADLDQYRPDTALIVTQTGDPTPTVSTEAAVNYGLIVGLGVAVIGIGVAAFAIRNRREKLGGPDRVQPSNP